MLRKVPLVEFQLYFLIYKPEFTWNYDGIWTFMMEFGHFMMEFGHFRTDLSINLMEILPIDPVGVKVSLVLGHLPGLGRVSTPIS